MKTNFHSLIGNGALLALVLGGSVLLAGEPPPDQPARKASVVVRGEPIAPASPASNTTPRTTETTNASLQETLARARVVAERMESNGFRTNATGHLVIGFETLSAFKCDTYRGSSHRSAIPS